MLPAEPFPGEIVLLVVHHLNESRSQRILWLLEELGVPYEIRFHSRDATTRLAPPALKAVRPYIGASIARGFRSTTRRWSN